MKQEVILAEIASTLNKCKFMTKNDTLMEEILKCSGLKSEYEINRIFFMKTVKNDRNGKCYDNLNGEYSFFRGLNNIFEMLYSNSRTEELVLLLSTIVEHINIVRLHEYGEDDDSFNMDKLISLYELMNLSLEVGDTTCTVKAWTGNTTKRIDQMFKLEAWLEQKFAEIYDAYISALDAFKEGHAGLCIEACRTTLTGMFSKFKGPDEFAKWPRGIGNIADELPGGQLGTDTTSAFKQATAAPSQDDLSQFFKENPHGRFTKTRAIYSIYSMMSDYGTHRQEGTPETPSMDDALMMLGMTEDILIWIHKKNKD